MSHGRGVRRAPAIRLPADAAAAAGADVYLTSDLRHHVVAEFVADPANPAVVDVAHWAGEWPWLAGPPPCCGPSTPTLTVTVSTLGPIRGPCTPRPRWAPVPGDRRTGSPAACRCGALRPSGSVASTGGRARGPRGGSVIWCPSSLRGRSTKDGRSRYRPPAAVRSTTPADTPDRMVVRGPESRSLRAAPPARRARIDQAISAAEHRRRTLPELALIAAGTSRVDELRNAGSAGPDRDRRSGPGGPQARQRDRRRAGRAKRDADRLAAGVAPAKDLENMQHEIVSLARRQSTLEDEALELMERREVADAALAPPNASWPPPEPTWRRPSNGGTTRSPTSTTDCSASRAERKDLVDGMPAELIGAVRADPRPRPGGGGGAERVPLRGLPDGPGPQRARRRSGPPGSTTWSAARSAARS